MYSFHNNNTHRMSRHLCASWLTGLVSVTRCRPVSRLLCLIAMSTTRRTHSHTYTNTHAHTWTRTHTNNTVQPSTAKFTHINIFYDAGHKWHTSYVRACVCSRRWSHRLTLHYVRSTKHRVGVAAFARCSRTAGCSLLAANFVLILYHTHIHKHTK